MRWARTRRASQSSGSRPVLPSGAGSGWGVVGILGSCQCVVVVTRGACRCRCLCRCLCRWRGRVDGRVLSRSCGRRWRAGEPTVRGSGQRGRCRSPREGCTGRRCGEGGGCRGSVVRTPVAVRAAGRSGIRGAGGLSVVAVSVVRITSGEVGRLGDSLFGGGGRHERHRDGAEGGPECSRDRDAPSAGGGPLVDATDAVGTEARRTMVGSEAGRTPEVCGTSGTAAPGEASARSGEGGRRLHRRRRSRSARPRHGEVGAVGALDAADHVDAADAADAADARR